jgi:hypothetical protein
VLRRICGHKRKVTGGRKLQNEKLHVVHFLPCVIRVNKYRRMLWAGHVARMEEVKVH